MLNKKSSIISIINQKGGVGKTTTTANLGHALAQLGFKTLVIDFDPQANASMVLGKLSPFEQPKTLADVYTSENTLYDCIIPTKYENLDLVSSHMDLFSIKIQITGTPDGIIGLKRAMDEKIISFYDFVLIDCQPDIGGALVTNALVTSDYYIVPIAAEDVFGLRGIKQLEASIKVIRDSLNPHLSLIGALITMSDKRSNATKIMTDMVTTYFKKESVFKTVIRRNAAINTAFLSNQTIFDFDKKTSGAEDYTALGEELAKKLRKKPTL